MLMVPVDRQVPGHMVMGRAVATDGGGGGQTKAVIATGVGGEGAEGHGRYYWY